MSFTLFGTVSGRNFTRGPTSCSLKVSTGEAFGYDHPGSVSGPSDSYTPTNCDKLPFKPTFAMAVGSQGTTGERQHPPMTVTVTQQPGEAGILGNGVTLPFEIGPHLRRLRTICTQRAARRRRLPAGIQGGHRERHVAVRGDAADGAGLPRRSSRGRDPGLVADLQGRVPIKLRIATAILGGKFIKSTVTDVPDLPVRSFTLKLDGGDKGVAGVEVRPVPSRARSSAR